MEQIVILAGFTHSTSAITTLTLYLLICVVYIALTASVIIRAALTQRTTLIPKKLMVIKTLSHMLIGIAGMFYLLGNHLTNIFFVYREELDCDVGCASAINDTANALVLVAILIFRLVPPFVIKMKNRMETPSEQPKWSYWRTTAYSLALVIELDAWYLVVAATVLESSPKHCEVFRLVFVLTLYSLILLVFLIFLTLVAIPVAIKAMLGKVSKMAPVSTGITLGLIWFCCALSLLADNEQPLGCCFGCDHTHIGNETELQTKCLEESFVGTRVGLLLLDMVLLVAMVTTLIAYGCINARMQRNESLTISFTTQSGNAKNITSRSIVLQSTTAHS